MHHEADSLSRDTHGAPLQFLKGVVALRILLFWCLYEAQRVGTVPSRHQTVRAPKRGRVDAVLTRPKTDRMARVRFFWLHQLPRRSASPQARTRVSGLASCLRTNLSSVPHAARLRRTPSHQDRNRLVLALDTRAMPAFATASWTRRFVLAGSSTNLSARGIPLCKFYFWGCTSVVFPTAHTCTRPANTTTGWGTGRPSHFASFHGASWSR